MTVTQGGIWTHELANGLPYSNQLSYQVTWKLSGWAWVLKTELPGIQLSRYQADMFLGSATIHACVFRACVHGVC